MRLISKHRNQPRTKIPRIAISQAEITADLHYPASHRVAGIGDGSRRRGSGR